MSAVSPKSTIINGKATLVISCCAILFAVVGGAVNFGIQWKATQYNETTIAGERRERIEADRQMKTEVLGAIHGLTDRIDLLMREGKE